MNMIEQRMHKREIRQFEVKLDGKKYNGIDLSAMGLSFEVPGYAHGVFFKGMPIHGRITSGDDYTYQFKGSVTNVRAKSLAKTTIHQVYGVKITWLESHRQHEKLLNDQCKTPQCQKASVIVTKDDLLVEVLRSCREIQKIGLDRNTSDSEFRTLSLKNSIV